MTNKTGTQNLTRTVPTDDPRKVAGYLATLAGEVDQRMATQYRAIGRSQIPPAALVRLNAPIAFNPSGSMPNIPFDTVEFDTTGDLVDLTVNPYVINLASPGYWAIGGYVAVSGWPGGTGELGVWLQAGGGTRVTGFRDGHNGVVSGSFSVLDTTDYPLTEMAALGAQFVGSLPAGQEESVLLFAELWAYKVRDL